MNLKVGQPYTITWTTPASEAKTHGVGGIAVLGISQCDVIRSNQPCTVNFTPTAAMLTVSRGPRLHLRLHADDVRTEPGRRTTA